MFTCGLDVVEPNTVLENLHFSNYKSAASNASALQDYLDSEVRSGHFLRTKVGSGPIPSRVVPLAFIPKPGQPGKFRLISDASAPEGSSTNSAFPEAPKFGMVTISDIMERVDEETWGSITDAESAFRNLPENPLHAGLLAVEFEGHYYWELRAPFGWTLAPFSWCRVSSVIQRFCALHGFNVVVYVDDFLAMGQSEEAANTAQLFLISLLNFLGFRDKPSKRIAASQKVPFIGFVIDFRNRSVSISPERATLIREDIEHVLSLKWVSPPTLRTLAGKLIFISQAVFGGRTFTRRIFDACSSQRSKGPLTAATRADLRWWLKYLAVFNGLRGTHWSRFRPRGYCSSDASSSGASGVCSYPRAWVHAWTDKQAWHINVRELWAVHRNLVLWSPKWGNHDVAVATDNAAVVAWINNGSARSPHAMTILRKIFWIQATRNIRVRATWVPSEVNVAADAGSRFRFDLLHAFTGLIPDQISLSGPVPPPSLILPSSLPPPQLSHHLQTLLPLKTSWDWSRSRVYSPLWQKAPLPLTGVHGTPFFGFSWPTDGLPSRLARSYSSDMLHGCSSRATRTPPSDPMSPLSRLSTLESESRSLWHRQISRPWLVASKEFGEVSKLLNLRLTSPSRIWSSSGPSSTSIPLVSLPDGPLSAWVSSPSFDPVTWFLSLKDLGNLVPTSRMAMSILLSGVQSFRSASPKLRNSMAPPSKSQSLTSQTPSSAPSSPLGVSTPLPPSRCHNPSSPLPPTNGSRIMTSEVLSGRWRRRRGSTQTSTGATVPEAGERPLPRRQAPQPSKLRRKGCGSLRRTSATSVRPSKSVGPSRP